MKPQAVVRYQSVDHDHGKLILQVGEKILYECSFPHTDPKAIEFACSLAESEATLQGYTLE